MIKIPLNNSNKYTIIDDDDYQKVITYKWHISSSGYARHTLPGSKSLFMQHLILPTHKKVDHINHDKLDNRKCNLRECSQAENSWNSGIRKNSKSGYKGIYFCTTGKRKKRWLAQIRIGNNKRLFLGRYYTKEEAAAVYNEAAKKYHGKFATLNILEREIYGDKK